MYHGEIFVFHRRKKGAQSGDDSNDDQLGIYGEQLCIYIVFCTITI